MPNRHSQRPHRHSHQCFDPKCPDRVSETDLIVLKAMAHGQTSRAGAAKANISHQTAKNRLSRLYRELGAVSIASALVAALKRGYLTLDDL